MRPRHASLAGCAVVALLWSAPAQAARTRPLFEPTDLELQAPGIVEIDAQVGELRSTDGDRAVVPDFELDIGLGRNAELDIDGQYAIEGPGAHGFRLDRPGPDNLWISSKLGLWDERDASRGTAWALGVQLGPKVPLARTNKGAGCEGLILIARTVGDAQLVLNAGALIDPGSEVASGRPAGFEGGLDLAVVLSAVRRLSLLGELGGVRFVSKEPHQLHATAGVSWGVSGSVDLTLTGLKGLLSGGDRYGVLVGIAERFKAW